MLSVAEARANMVAAVGTLASETVALGDARGRVLAGPLFAGRDQPPFAASAMDGFALASADHAADFKIVGESAAGRAFDRELARGEAVRISTGAPLPVGADGVLIQEEAEVTASHLLQARVAAMQNVRPRAVDFRAGELLLSGGRRLDPIALALAASAGCAKLEVVRQPRIAVLAGGDEVAPVGRPLRDDQVYESGSFAVRGLIEAWGGIAVSQPLLLDEVDAICAASASALAACDLLVMIGGASVGAHDLARPALDRLGVKISVERVSVRPGKPTWFGVCPAGAVLGLPGNPASAIVCTHLFLRPVLEAMLGLPANAEVTTHEGSLLAPLDANGVRETYLRGRVDGAGGLRAHTDQDSSLLSVFAASNCLIVRPANAPAARAGDRVAYIPLAG